MSPDPARHAYATPRGTGDKTMSRLLWMIVASAALCGCGVAEIGAAAATTGAGAAEQAKQAQDTLPQVEADLQAAHQTAAEARRNAGAAAEKPDPRAIASERADGASCRSGRCEARFLLRACASSGTGGLAMRFGTEDYRPDGVFDELVDSGGEPRPAARAICAYLAGLDAGEMRSRRQAI